MMRALGRGVSGWGLGGCGFSVGWRPAGVGWRGVASVGGILILGAGLGAGV